MSPALLALALLLVGAWRARRVIGGELRRLGWPLLAWLGLALLVRLVGVPALERHVYDGHEAEYYDLFTGERALSRGGPVLYPAMQWLWWGLGKLLPAHPVLPVLLSAAWSTAGAGLVAAGVGVLTDRRAGWLAALLLALHPVHAAWSTSAYNVGLPFALGALAFCCAALLLRRPRPPQGLALLGACAGALAVGTRIDSAPWGGLVFLLALTHGLTGGREAGLRLVRLLPAAALGGVLAVACAWPVLFPGELPGEGERALAFALNAGWLDPLTPFDHPVLVGVWLVLGLAAARRWPAAGLVFLAWPPLVHLLFATFDDYADRHALLALPGIAGAVAAGAVAWARRPAGRVLAGLGLALVVGAEGLALADLHARYYASEEAFTAELRRGAYGELPRWSAAEARRECGWVAEDPRVAEAPFKSHFNLLDAEEAESLRSEGGCLRWCPDVQDWRWSSRGVRDRALRMSRLYTHGAVAVVEEPASGYSCLVVQLGARRCCHVGRSGPVPPPDPGPVTAEDHARTAPGAPGLP